MLPPYETAEVAEAVRRRARDLNVALADLLVVADLRTGEWRVAAVLPAGRRVVVSLPFSTPEGIVLPVDVAARVFDRIDSP